jgi:hypothetical protein
MTSRQRYKAFSPHYTFLLTVTRQIAKFERQKVHEDQIFEW